MTITSIGYGDIHAQDNNIAEQAINTILMLTGAVIWGNLIGTFCGVVATMNPHTAEFNRRMDDLNRYVSQVRPTSPHSSPQLPTSPHLSDLRTLSHTSSQPCRLNRCVSQHAIDHDLRRRLREYLHQTRHLQVRHLPTSPP